MTGLIVPMREQPEKTATVHFDGEAHDYFGPHKPCPYRSGDVLRVREVWRIGAWDYHRRAVAIDYKTDGHCRREWLPVRDVAQFIIYASECSRDASKSGFSADRNGGYHWQPGQSPCRWRSPQTMLSEYSRISLTLKADPVPVRVKDVTEEQMIAMGTGHIYYVDDILAARRYAFEQYWDDSYGKRYPYSTAWGWWFPKFETEVRK